MNKALLGCVAAASLAMFSAGVSAAPKSFSTIEFGFETITYREDINFLNRFEISQDSLVVNPIQHTLSYTGLESNEDFGFYLESTSTLFKSYELEEWTMGDYGQVQSNNLLMSTIDVKLLGAYTVTPRSQLLAGVSFFVLDFTRSGFLRDEGGEQLHADVIAGDYDDLHTAEQLLWENCETIERGASEQRGKGFCQTLGAVSENQSSVEFILGYLYDSNLGLSSEFSWFAQAELALPIWHRTTNSELSGIALDEYFGGYGVNTRLGMRWSVTDQISLTLGAGASYKSRDAVSGTNSNGAPVAVPNVEYTNLQMFAGLSWFI